MQHARLAACLAALSPFAPSGCGGDADPLAGLDPVASVEVTPDALDMWPGDTARLAATARTAAGTPLDDWPIHWSSSDPQVAVVDAQGRVRAVGPGVAAISAESWGRSDTARVVVTGYDLTYELQAGGRSEVFFLAFEAGDPVRILPEGMQGADPAPSPDRRRLAVVGPVVDGNTDIFLVNRDGSGSTGLTHDAEVDDQPAWSPDGRRIAFRSFRNGRLGDIWAMNDDGSEARDLTPDPLPGVSDEARPAWSPDGSRIAYASNRGGDMDIWIMESDGADPRRLTDTPDFDTEPSWSPDGTRIAFRRSDPQGGSDIAIVDAATGQVERIVRAGEDRMPAWSPDGELIAFVSQPAVNSPRSDIYTMRPDGSEVERRTTDGAAGLRLNPAWLRRF